MYVCLYVCMHCYDIILIFVRQWTLPIRIRHLTVIHAGSR